MVLPIGLGVPSRFRNTFCYEMKMRCVMWLGRDEPVTSEIAAINFGPASCRFAGLVGERIEQTRHKCCKYSD